MLMGRLGAGFKPLQSGALVPRDVPLVGTVRQALVLNPFRAGHWCQVALPSRSLGTTQRF